MDKKDEKYMDIKITNLLFDIVAYNGTLPEGWRQRAIDILKPFGKSDHSDLVHFVLSFGKKHITAIRGMRERTGMTLKDAKEFVDKVWAEHEEK